MSTALRSDPVDIAAGHLEAGRVAEAQALYEEVLRDQPTHPRALCGLGSIALGRGEVERGFELIAHAASLAPADGPTLGNLAVAYLARNELASADDCARRALDLESGSAGLHATFATVRMAHGDFAGALEAQRHALALDPTSAVQHFNMGNLQLSAGRPAEAASAFQAALDHDAGHAGALNNLAQLHLQAGRIEVARQLLDRARLQDPLNPELMANQADLLLRSGQPDRALEQIRRAADLAPRNPLLRCALATVLMELGRLEEAGSVLADAMRAAPEDATVPLALARLLRRQGRLDAAGIAIDRALALEDASPATRSFAAELLLMTGRHAEAWERLDPVFAGGRTPFDEPDLGPGADLAGVGVRLVAVDGAAALFAARCLPALAGRGAVLTVVCPPVLATLFGTATGVEAVVPMAGFSLADLAADGRKTVILDALPHRLRITPTDPDPVVPVFDVAPARSRDGTALAVGLWWEGAGPGAALAEALSGVAGPTLVSLQTGEDRLAAADMLAAAGIVDRGRDIDGFLALAAEIRAVDLVIAPNGPVAHLAAGLGVETWVLVDRDGSWYWPEPDGPASWYPRARVFRQGPDGDWSNALKAIRDALAPVTDPSPTPVETG